jgi:hypothetical protein
MKMRHEDPVEFLTHELRALLLGENVGEDLARSAALLRAMRQVHQSVSAQRKLGLSCMNQLTQHVQAQVDAAKAAKGSAP